MDRRAFLSGLFGVASVATLGGLTLRSAQAVPIARALDQPKIKPEAQAAEAGRTPDGTEVENAHYTGWRHSHRRRRRRRTWRRRRSRVVCRTYWRRGRRFRSCHRVWW
jgi:hypothetical protein